MLSEAHLNGIEKRGLSVEIATFMGLYSGTRLRDGSVRPDLQGDTLCFPYVEGGVEVNTKMRFRNEAGERDFRQITGRPKTFFNAQIFEDDERMTALEVGTESLVITEGEFDCLAAIECGYPCSVSVPDGAPPARSKDGRLIEVPMDTRGIDPANDLKYSYISRNWNHLEKVKTFIIATDGDEPGGRLAKELVRRLGPARCFWVEYPKTTCVPDNETGELRAPKDLNEVLLYMGREAVEHVLQNVKPWPVKNLYRFSDFPDVGDPITYPTMISPELDEIFRPYPGAFIVTTGIPNMGKSEIVKQAMVNMAKHHGWVSVYFPGEEPVKPYLENSLKTKYLGKHKSRWTNEDRMRSEAFLEKYIRIVTNDPNDEDEGEIDIDFLIDKAATAVHRDGAKLLIIDPWNELAHNMKGFGLTTEYVGEAIRKLKRFARAFDVCVWVVAHPKKVEGRPGLYDISDSAHWANKPDLALIVDSEDPLGTMRDVIIPKVRFKAAGRKGEVKMDFDRELEMYVPAPV